MSNNDSNVPRAAPPATAAAHGPWAAALAQFDEDVIARAKERREQDAKLLSEILEALVEAKHQVKELKKERDVLKGQLARLKADEVSGDGGDRNDERKRRRVSGDRGDTAAP